MKMTGSVIRFNLNHNMFGEQKTDFVLDLHHQHGTVIFIYLFDMSKQLLKCFRIRFNILLVEQRQDICNLNHSSGLSKFSAWEAFRIRLHP